MQRAIPEQIISFVLVRLHATRYTRANDYFYASSSLCNSAIVSGHTRHISLEPNYYASMTTSSNKVDKSDCVHNRISGVIVTTLV